MRLWRGKRKKIPDERIPIHIHISSKTLRFNINTVPCVIPHPGSRAPSNRIPILIPDLHSLNLTPIVVPAHIQIHHRYKVRIFGEERPARFSSLVALPCRAAKIEVEDQVIGEAKDTILVRCKVVQFEEERVGIPRRVYADV
jgi:hypothetical protein